MFTNKFMMVASEELRNSYMIAFKFIFTAKYKKSHLLSMCVYEIGGVSDGRMWERCRRLKSGENL